MLAAPPPRSAADPHSRRRGSERRVLGDPRGRFLHGSAAGSDVRNHRLADPLGVAVASVDCRLAPEHPWPAAPADCETAAL
ncbi:alpha/beta hydrolase [Virgisporangium aurantiacum]|uniref:alpha/beta hydrolase n=1 Tax=Virgisporangium aurantiacum TaxID=175570 RepID=UPI001EF25A16|nr:alpha/beta hydrolase fold domain-containing protein [Virgisporangium aurantiacum]